MEKVKKIGLIGWLMIGLLAGGALATPSTNVWNPSTDIQAAGAWHLGIDNYFSLNDTSSGGGTFPTDLGVTYGLLPGLEIGLDGFYPPTGAAGISPFTINVKYGLAESEVRPALAVGGFGFSSTPATQANVVYGVAAKSFAYLGRISLGYFTGAASVIGADNKGFIAAWDKAVNDQLWVCLDYASGNSTLGAAFAGFSWLFSPNTSVIFGYGTYNNGATPTLTTQLDINI